MLICTTNFYPLLFQCISQTSLYIPAVIVALAVFLSQSFFQTFSLANTQAHKAKIAGKHLFAD
jgi:hypothetical protein